MPRRKYNYTSYVEKTIKSSGLQYFLGSIITILYGILVFKLLDNMPQKEAVVWLLLLIVPGTFALFYLLNKISHYLALGFISVIFSVSMFIVLFFVELTIHPPSETI